MFVSQVESISAQTMKVWLLQFSTYSPLATVVFRGEDESSGRSLSPVTSEESSRLVQKNQLALATIWHINSWWESQCARGNVDWNGLAPVVCGGINGELKDCESSNFPPALLVMAGLSALRGAVQGYTGRNQTAFNVPS